MINPDIVHGMTYGGIAHGIGAALYERFAYDENGQLVSGTFMDYLMPSAHEVPDITIVDHCTPSPLTSFGQKGSGEAGYLGAPAAIASAVNDALAPLGLTHRRTADDACRARRIAGGKRRGLTAALPPPCPSQEVEAVAILSERGEQPFQLPRLRVHAVWIATTSLRRRKRNRMLLRHSCAASPSALLVIAMLSLPAGRRNLLLASRLGPPHSVPQANHREGFVMKPMPICALALVVGLAAPTRAEDVVALHRLSAGLGAEAVTEAVAACAKQGYKVTATSSISMAWNRPCCAATAR